MPKYRFTCTSCTKEIERFTSAKTEEVVCPLCSSIAKREFPIGGSQQVLETVDTYTNVKHEVDHNKNIKDRKTEHFWEVEVPRLVQTYSVQTCLEEGWLVYNDKGELVVNKPPSKR